MVHAEDAHLPQKWVLEARLFDAKTGAEASKPYLISDADHPYPRWQDCNKVLQNLGPAPAHEGKIIIFRCYRLDAQDERTL